MLLCQREDALHAFLTDSCQAMESCGAFCVAGVPVENSHFRVNIHDAQNNRATCPMSYSGAVGWVDRSGFTEGYLLWMEISSFHVEHDGCSSDWHRHTGLSRPSKRHLGAAGLQQPSPPAPAPRKAALGRAGTVSTPSELLSAYVALCNVFSTWRCFK